MKTISKLLVILAVALTASFNAQAAVEKTAQVCNGNVTVKVLDLAPNTDFTALVTRYVIEVAPDAVEDCNSLVITPVVKKDDNKTLTEIVVVNGKGRTGHNRKWLECQLYTTVDPNRVRFFSLKEGETLRIITEKEVPYEAWMDDADFNFTVQKASYWPTNCIKAFTGEEAICHVPFLKKPFEVYPHTVALNIPTPDLSGVAPRVITTKLFYPVNGTAKLDKYLENAEALEVLNALNQDNYYVSSIVINGWASPESSVAYNQALSVKRANTLKNLIAKKYDFAKELYTVTGSGEYWDNVIEYVATTDEPAVAAAKADIQQAIADNADLDKREAAIKKIAGGKPYRAMLKNSYPHSRFANCVVTYKIKEFDLADAKVLFAANPESLTKEDYITWMNTEFCAEVAYKATELYPDCQELFAFAGFGAYQEGKYAEAAQYYKKAGDSQEVMNNLGCCYLQLQDVPAAEACFEKAGDLNVAPANVIETRKVSLNKHYFSK